MAFDGSGNFTRVHNYVTDKAGNVPVTASRVDADLDDMVTGLELALLRDGQNAASGNINLGSNKIINLANATLTTDAMALGQLQSNTGRYAATTGSANAYVLTPAPAITAYAAGQKFICNANFANTGSATLAVSGLAATTIKTPDGASLVGAEIASGQIFEVVYDGTDFILVSAVNQLESIVVAASDEGSDLEVGTAALTFRMPYAFTLSEVRASVTTAPTGSAITVDINETATTILSTKLTIDATEKTSTTAATPAIISDSALADDAEITIDIDVIGSTVAGTGLKVALIGRRA